MAHLHAYIHVHTYIYTYMYIYTCIYVYNTWLVLRGLSIDWELHPATPLHRCRFITVRVFVWAPRRWPTHAPSLRCHSCIERRDYIIHAAPNFLPRDELERELVARIYIYIYIRVQVLGRELTTLYTMHDVL